MELSQKGLNRIKKWEGFSSKPYLCPAGIPTIGYGNTLYEDKSKVTLKDNPITEERATELLKSVIKNFEKGVITSVTSSINQNQFDSLVDFSYNLGLGNLKSSTLLKKVNKDPNDKSIWEEFLKWDKCNGKVLEGLLARRTEEATIYFLTL